MLRALLLAIVLLATTAAEGAVTVVRDDQQRIATLEIGVLPGRKAIVHRVEAEPGRDLRDAPATLRAEMAIGAGVLRFVGGPVAFATPLVRDPATGPPLAGESGPSDEVFASLSAVSDTARWFALICASSIGFSDPEIEESCRSASWLSLASGEQIPISETTSAAFRALPADPTPLEEALLGCGPAYGTSCAQDGIDLRFADPSVLYQRFPGLEAPLPAGGDSVLLATAAWNWFARHALASGVEPGVGEAAGCSFEMPDGCASLGIEPGRFAARRVLPDEPVAGPVLRWDWELGTTFELTSLEVEGDLSPALVALAADSLPQRVHVVGPFEGGNGEPDAVAIWIPEPDGSLAAATALGALAVLVCRRG